MIRRNNKLLNYWVQYSFAGASPKVDGPPPKDAPQNFNSVKAQTALDPVEDSFPLSIRGRLMYPDVPMDQFTPMWYVCEQTTFTDGELKSWVASAPPNAYRFRPFDEFDKVGREFVEDMKKFNHRETEGFQFREASLTKMNGTADAPKKSLATMLDRAVKSKIKLQPHRTPMAVQRDVGRVEPVPPVAGNIPVDNSVFPFKWKTDDWYEYEVAKVRNRRFKIENPEGVNGSEVTYRLVIEAQWDMHAKRMADDVCDFIRDVGRQVVEERLTVIRRHLESLRNGGLVDSEILKSTPGYADEELRFHCEAELSVLEQQCVSMLTKMTGESVDRYDANKSWPVVENLEPWKRMAEYWAAMGDKHWSHMQASTRKVEFRKFYRVISVKMPFVSQELEKRIYDIRHWAHRGCTLEYQTIYRRNLIHDTTMFPVEHDPITPLSEENHRAFSFALDWEEAPARQASTEVVLKDDTWESVAERLGTTPSALKKANRETTALSEGAVLNVPLGSSKSVTSFGHGKAYLDLKKDGGKRVFDSWEAIATAVGCDVTELQELNQELCDDKGSLTASAERIRVPFDLAFNNAKSEFATTEVIEVGDTWGSIARRLGTTVKSLRAANPNVTSLVPGSQVAVSHDAKNLRRINDPLLTVDADTLTSRLNAEMAASGLKDGIPTAPEGAEKFKHEFIDSSTRYPIVPNEVAGSNDWLTYTATYLDPGLGNAAEAQPLYTVNQLWPVLQTPGKVDQTPFEEDQTWMMHHIPLQRKEIFHPEGYLQDLPNVNHEVFPRSLDWQSP